MDTLWTPWRYQYITGSPDPDRDASRKGVPLALAAWPGDRHCVFCNLIAAVDYAIEHGMAEEAADRAAYVVYRDTLCFVCMNAYPYATGHILILPYEHQSSLADLPAETAMQMMALAQRAERCLRGVYHPDGLNMGMNLGEAAGAGVAAHLHLHALPRWTGDSNFMTVVAETRILPEMLEQGWQRLRAAFREQN